MGSLPGPGPLFARVLVSDTISQTKRDWPATVTTREPTTREATAVCDVLEPFGVEVVHSDVVVHSRLRTNGSFSSSTSLGVHVIDVPSGLGGDSLVEYIPSGAHLMKTTSEEPFPEALFVS